MKVKRFLFIPEFYYNGRFVLINKKPRCKSRPTGAAVITCDKSNIDSLTIIRCHCFDLRIFFLIVMTRTYGHPALTILLTFFNLFKNSLIFLFCYLYHCVSTDRIQRMNDQKNSLKFFIWYVWEN